MAVMAVMALARGGRRFARACAIQALVEHRLKPISEKEAKLRDGKRELEVEKAALEAKHVDWTRRMTEAQEHAAFQLSKKDEKLELMRKWHDEKHHLLQELNGLKTGIKQKAREIGDDSIDERLADVHSSKSLEQYEQMCSKESTSLREYARHHHHVLHLSAKIKDTKSEVIRTEQVAEQQKHVAHEAAEEIGRLKKELLCKTDALDTVSKHLEDLSEERRQTELYEDELRKVREWAQCVAPDVGITAETLPMLRLQRRQSMDHLFGPGSDVKVLKCSAWELRRYHGVVGTLKKQGHCPSVLKNMGFSVKELADDYRADEVLKGGFSKEELMEFPSIIKELKKLGYSAADLKEKGFSVVELARDYAADEVLHAGFSKDELMAFPLIISKLKNLGYSAEKLRDLGFSVTELRIYTPLELVRAGFSKDDLSTIFRERIIQAALACGSELKHFEKVDLKDAGYHPQQVFPESAAPTAWFRYLLI